MFKHALTQDAAYASLLRTKRQELHERIAETLEASYAERVRVEPEVVAHHYTQAGRSQPAAKYWAAAARRAIDRREPRGIGSRDQGTGASGRCGAGSRAGPPRAGPRGLAWRSLPRGSGFASSDAERSFMRARELCEKLDDMRGLIDVRRGLFSSTTPAAPLRWPGTRDSWSSGRGGE